MLGINDVAHQVECVPSVQITLGLTPNKYRKKVNFKHVPDALPHNAAQGLMMLILKDNPNIAKKQTSKESISVTSP